MFLKPPRTGVRSCLLLAALVVLAALSIRCGPRTIELAPGDAAASAPTSSIPDWSDWGLTLSLVVVGDRVDFAGLVRDHEALNRFLLQASRWGPETTPDHFPDRDGRLAFFINCHNAAVLRSIVELAAGAVPPAWVPADLEARYWFRIDGRLQTAAGLRASAEKLAGEDWRVRLALYDARQSGPPLPPHAFLGDLLDAQLRQNTQAALLSPRVIKIEHGESKRVLVWRGLYEVRDRLVREFEIRLNTRNASFLNVLLDWADRPQRGMLNSAVGYEIALLPPDSTLNAVEPPPAAQKGLGAVLHSIRSITFLRPQAASAR